MLRQALGDDAQEPSYVQTVPRRGYRFIASVEPARDPVPAEVASADADPSGSLWTPWFPWLACFAGGLAVGVLALALQARPAVGTAPVTRFTLALPAGQHLASGSSLAVSADGRLIVGVLEDAAGARGAWVRPLEAATFQFLPGSEGARQPFVSADGDRVGIVVGDRVRVMTMPSGAWSTVATAPLVRGATWLADGALVFASGADGALRKVASRGGEPIDHREAAIRPWRSRVGDADARRREGTGVQRPTPWTRTPALRVAGGGKRATAVAPGK